MLWGNCSPCETLRRRPSMRYTRTTTACPVVHTRAGAGRAYDGRTPGFRHSYILSTSDAMMIPETTNDARPATSILFYSLRKRTPTSLSSPRRGRPPAAVLQFLGLVGDGVVATVVPSQPHACLPFFVAPCLCKAESLCYQYSRWQSSTLTPKIVLGSSLTRGRRTQERERGEKQWKRLQQRPPQASLHWVGKDLPLNGDRSGASSSSSQ